MCMCVYASVSLHVCMACRLNVCVLVQAVPQVCACVFMCKGERERECVCVCVCVPHILFLMDKIKKRVVLWELGEKEEKIKRYTVLVHSRTFPTILCKCVYMVHSTRTPPLSHTYLRAL